MIKPTENTPLHANIEVTYAQPSMNVENEKLFVSNFHLKCVVFVWKFIHSLVWCNELEISSTPATCSSFSSRQLLVAINFAFPSQVGL